MTDPKDAVDVIASTGRRVPKVWKTSDGEIRVYDPASDPCHGCGQTTMPGESITKVYWSWWHASCAQAWMDQAGEAEAWRMIARQVAAHPSRYRTPVIRTVIEQLLAMTGNDPVDVADLKSRAPY